MTAVEVTPSLQNLSDYEFEDVVNQDVRGVLDPQLARRLRNPETAERWYNQLLELKWSVEAQLTGNRAERNERHVECLSKGASGKPDWLTYKVTSDRWRAGAVRFKAGVERKLNEAKTLRQDKRSDRYVDLVEAEREKAVREVGRLRTLILHHRDHKCTAVCDDGCLADDELWRVLESEPRM